MLGKSCGFYVVAHDEERNVARLAYQVDADFLGETGKPIDPASCDAIRERRVVMDDGFARSIADNVATSIAVPLMRNTAVLGCIGVYTRQPRVYEPHEVHALVAIAGVAAFALQNSRYLRKIEQAQLEAEQFEEIGRAISASLDLPEVLSGVVEAALKLLQSESATVWLMRGDNELEAAMTAGEIAPTRGLVVPLPAALRRRVEELAEPYFFYENINDDAYEIALRSTKAGSMLAVPLVAEERILGALAVGHKKPRRYHDSDISLLHRLSLNASIAVTNAHMHEQIRALALTDPLTTLPNRRHLDMFLEKEYAAAQRGRQLSVLLFDLDQFKEYNDRMGHQAGDDVLRAFASVLIAQTRMANLAARYGGDEFITILADTDRRGAQATADRVMRAMRSHPLLKQAGVRASVGISTFNAKMASFEDLIRAADRDLYLRKAARKKRVT